ncbi:hypothetical protein WA026_011133 [Henosepilachna vigintioctopunctata]|uniref:SID1 transmembrane family member 1-like n=1 Tax=Henosepilachna vigintioctopunctata TaxID=420089 RepID=A0AAW1U711_9CUCU
MKLKLYTLVFVISFCSCLDVVIKKLNYNENYAYEVNRTVEYILQFSSAYHNFPSRVTIDNVTASIKEPLMVVTRQPDQLLSWQIPLQVESDSGIKLYQKTSRTLCKNILESSSVTQQEKEYVPIVAVSTASEKNVSFSINVEYQREFYIELSKDYEFTITPSEPRYFFYNFSVNITRSEEESNYHTVILEVESTDQVCMTVSIQNASCPVLDLNQDITYRGFYETVNTRGGITIPKFKFPSGFYVVFVAKADDTDCTGKIGMVEPDRVKNIVFRIKPSISYNDYINAVIATLSGIGLFYLLFGLGFTYCSFKDFIPRNMQYALEFNPESVPTTPSGPGEEVDDNASFNETEYDTISEESIDKQNRLHKSELYLSDLAKKDPRILKRKSYLYLYNVLTIALFYGLPVVQLVITYQRVLNETGEQDLCYYNFLCAHPVGVISDFNHVFSNIGYILLGVLFLWITYRRAILHSDLNFDRQYGIPQHYGLFYSMGVALIMEGVLSGSYHICPNHSNFQFDSSFMYVMAVLCMVKLYQNRHPDINATAYSTFGVLALAILLGMIGILNGNVYFWIFFTIVYILACLLLSLQIYFMGCWKCDRGAPIRVYRSIRTDLQLGPLNVLKPVHKARMVLLIIGNICNWTLAGWGLYDHQKDFALFLLAVFMANTLLYFFFYIVMKLIHGEKIKYVTWFFLFCAISCALASMYFFLHKSISWAKTPAESRQYNQECKLLRFYDFHDIWHFLSAVGMFFTFMVLLTLDDDLSHKDRAVIPVF